MFSKVNSQNVYMYAFTKLSDGTTYADFGNYGATVIWDFVLGTLSPEYSAFRRDMRLRGR